MAPAAFLSDEWIEQARAIYDEAAQKPADPNMPSITMNLVLTGVPFSEGNLLANLDTTSGVFRIDKGPLDSAEIKLTMDYSTARDILIGGDTGAGMRAFLGGKIRVEGNMAKLLSLQGAARGRDDDVALKRLREITA